MSPHEAQILLRCHTHKNTCCSFSGIVTTILRKRGLFSSWTLDWLTWNQPMGWWWHIREEAQSTRLTDRQDQEQDWWNLWNAEMNPGNVLQSWSIFHDGDGNRINICVNKKNEVKKEKELINLQILFRSLCTWLIN